LTPIKLGAGENHTVALVKAATSPSPIWSPGEPLSAGKTAAIFATARRLRAESHAGGARKSLRGKNLALLHTTPSGRELSPLHRAAQDLGARVAEVRFEADASKQPDIGALARLLGRMYDAIDCDTLPPSTIQRIEMEASVPVYAGLGLDNHPARALADLLTLCEHGSTPDSRTDLLFIGDPQTPRSSTFLWAARELGFALQLAEQGRPESSELGFVVDATNRPEWSLYAHGRLIEDSPRSANHCCVIQTVLLDTIPRA
jgi:ornithine carbamoyltransferase